MSAGRRCASERARHASGGPRRGCGGPRRARFLLLPRGGCPAGAPALRLPALALLGWTFGAHAAAAQDLEVLAERGGAPLPAVYYLQMASDPSAYSFSRALFNRTAAGRTAARGAPAPGRALVTRDAGAPSWQAAAAPPALAPVRGTIELPVVLALFADSPEPHISGEAIQASLFDGPSEHGTITEVYREMSRDALEVTGDVFPWVRTGKDLADVLGGSGGLAGQIGAYFTEALDSLDDEVDFARYDNDGPDGVPNSGDDDGYVDVITFEYLEIAASCGGPGIWPHRWTMTARTGAPYETGDVSRQDSVSHVRIEDYITQSVADCTGIAVQDASTISHEFGHALGLPDYYHGIGGSGPFDRRWVMGCWALMAGGAWGCGEVEEERRTFGPTHLMAYSKYQLGWVDLLEPGDVRNQELFLDPVQASGMALRVPMDEEGREFLIVEYRTRTGFDDELPAAGVVIYKQDLSAGLHPSPSTEDPYFLTLLERDGNRGLVRTWHEGGNRGEAGDAWGVDGAVGELHAASMPALRLSDGAPTSVTVHEISVVDGSARVVLSTVPEPQIVAPAGPLTVTRVRSFLESMRVAGGTMPYAVTGTAPQGVTLSSDGDDVVVAGSVWDPGPFELRLAVTDAVGRASPELVVPLATTEWAPSLGELLQPLLDSHDTPLTPGEISYLDALGNGNGTYDVGDLRKWLGEGG